MWGFCNGDLDEFGVWGLNVSSSPASHLPRPLLRLPLPTHPDVSIRCLYRMVILSGTLGNKELLNLSNTCSSGPIRGFLKGLWRRRCVACWLRHGHPTLQGLHLFPDSSFPPVKAETAGSLPLTWETWLICPAPGYSPGPASAVVGIWE